MIGIAKPTMSAGRMIYLPEIIRGLLITVRHLIRKKPVTYEYPEKAKPVPENFRGLHRLIERPASETPALGASETLTRPASETPALGASETLTRPGGKERCVACELCLTACPANCISMVAADPNDPNVEKYPLLYEIDILRCIYCGFCEEACPCDAIELTPHYELASSRRDDFIHTKEKLLANNRYVPERERVSKVRTNETYLRVQDIQGPPFNVQR